MKKGFWSILCTIQLPNISLHFKFLFVRSVVVLVIFVMFAHKFFSCKCRTYVMIKLSFRNDSFSFQSSFFSCVSSYQIQKRDFLLCKAKECLSQFDFNMFRDILEKWESCLTLDSCFSL